MHLMSWANSFFALVPLVCVNFVLFFRPFPPSLNSLPISILHASHPSRLTLCHPPVLSLAFSCWNDQINTGIEFQTGGGVESIGFLRYDSDYNMGASASKEDWIFPNGYDQLVTYLATSGNIATANSAGGNLNILTGKAVTAINYGNGRCTVTTGDGAQYVADICVSTIPAGVMKRRNPIWAPSFPADKAAALQRIQMGDLGGPNKVFILFETKFWVSDALFNGFMQSAPTRLNRGKWSYMVDFSKVLNKPVLLAFCLGEYGATMEQQSLWDNWVDIKAGLQAMCTAGGSDVCSSPITDPISSTANILYVGGGTSGTIKSGAVRSTWITVRCVLHTTHVLQICVQCPRFSSFHGVSPFLFCICRTFSRKAHTRTPAWARWTQTGTPWRPRFAIRPTCCVSRLPVRRATISVCFRPQNHGIIRCPLMALCNLSTSLSSPSAH
jgi:hypothetical protein